MPVYDYLLLVQSDTANTTDAIGTNTINFGIAYPGVDRGHKFGLHVIVTTSFTSLTEGVNLWIIHSASDNLSTSSEKLNAMFVPAAEMVKGAHFFIPLGTGRTPLQYMGFLWDVVSTSGATGKTTVYFGDAEP